MGAACSVVNNLLAGAAKRDWSRDWSNSRIARFVRRRQDRFNERLGTAAANAVRRGQSQMAVSLPEPTCLMRRLERQWGQLNGAGPIVMIALFIRRRQVRFSERLKAKADADETVASSSSASSRRSGLSSSPLEGGKAAHKSSGSITMVGPTQISTHLMTQAFGT